MCLLAIRELCQNNDEVKNIFVNNNEQSTPDTSYFETVLSKVRENPFFQQSRSVFDASDEDDNSITLSSELSSYNVQYFYKIQAFFLDWLKGQDIASVTKESISEFLISYFPNEGQEPAFKHLPDMLDLWRTHFEALFY